MRNRIVITILLTVLSAVWCLFPRIALNAGNASYQQVSRSGQSKRTVRTGRASDRGSAPRDYSKFSHRSNKHKSLTCAACHMAPTNNWPTASGLPGRTDYRFPDVADYPTHDACTRCHRAQFFKGAQPVICSICHTKVSPRGRERFAFEKPNQPSQFSDIFPHNKHQDVIASIGFEKGFASAHFMARASFAADEKKEKYNNCTICHATQVETPNPQGGFPDNFKPLPGTFKAAPVVHSSCFNCHWKNQEPTHENCAGCHRLSDTDIPILLAPVRKSLKFQHEHERHKDECTVCHINITREISLVGLKPDVPITSCGGPTCHGKSTKKDKVTIATETRDRRKSRSYTCIKCHVSEVGKRDEPPSHIAALKD